MDELKELEERKQQLLDAIGELELQNNSLAKTLGAKTSSLNNLEVQIEALEQDIETSRQALSAAISEQEKVTSNKLEETVALIAEAESDRASLQKEVTALAQQKRDIEQDIVTLQDGKAAFLSDTTKERDALIQQKSAELKEVEKEISIAETNRAEFEATLNGLSNKVIRAKELLSETERARVELDAAIVDAQKRRAQAEQDALEALKKSVEAQQSLDGLRGEITAGEELSAQIASLTLEAQKLENTIATLTPSAEEAEQFRADKLQFEKDRAGISQQKNELDQRMAFVKGVYSDFNFPW